MDRVESEKDRENVICLLHDDTLVMILEKLHAKDMAYAACLNKRWKRVCGIVFSRPKITATYSVELTVIISKLSEHIPLITNSSMVNFGMEKFLLEDLDDDLSKIKASVIVTIGSIAGLLVDAVPLFQREGRLYLDKFHHDIRTFSESPAEILVLFGAGDADMERMIGKIGETFAGIIIGGSGKNFEFQSKKDYNVQLQRQRTGPFYKVAAVGPCHEKRNWNML